MLFKSLMNKHMHFYSKVCKKESSRIRNIETVGGGKLSECIDDFEMVTFY